MTDTLFVLVLLCNFFIVIFFLKVIYPREGIASPITVVLFFYLFQYPIRAICLYLSNDTSFEIIFERGRYGFDSGEIVEALIYATLYIFLLVGFYTLISGSHKSSSIKANAHSNIAMNSHQNMVLYIVMISYFMVFLYKFMTGDLYTLYYELDDLKRPFLINLLYIVLNLKWFLLAYWFLSFLRKKPYSAFVLLAISATIIIEAIISTGKGRIVTLIIVMACSYWFVKGKLPKWSFVVSTCVILLFCYYSSISRQIAPELVRKSQETVIRSTSMVFSSVVDDYHVSSKPVIEKVITIFNRLNALDGLILCQRNRENDKDNLYSLGSLIELGNIVPRIFWSDRPHLSFNHHITSSVWEIHYNFFEMPIGKIGESFFVLQWMGVLYALFYAFLWNWLHKSLLIYTRSDMKRALYFSLMVFLIFSDSTLVHNIKDVIIVTLFYNIIKLLNTKIIRVNNRSINDYKLSVLQQRAILQENSQRSFS